MKRSNSIDSVRLTFYPMAGGIDEQFHNLLRTLSWINSNQPTPDEVHHWLKTVYSLSDYFARDVYTVIFISSGILDVLHGRCSLAKIGRSILSSVSPVQLIEAFERNFFGITAVLEILRVQNHLDFQRIVELWYGVSKDRHPRIINWSKRTLENQCRHRINWLRALGFIHISHGGIFSLTESGCHFVISNPPEALSIQVNEVIKEEKKLKDLLDQDFKLFSETTKTQSLRQAYVRDKAFSCIVTTEYDYHCAICDFSFKTPEDHFESQAAHIVPKRLSGTDDPRNGICMCRTCHWLFDEGVLSINAKNKSVLVASYAKTSNTRSNQNVVQYSGKIIRPTIDLEYIPDTDALSWHNGKIFLG